MASINDIDDDVLLKIFIDSSPRMKHAVYLSRVCRRWSKIMESRFSMVKYLVFYHEDLYISRFLRVDEVESNHGDANDNNLQNAEIINDRVEVVIEQVIDEHRLGNEDLEIGRPMDENENQLNNALEEINEQFKERIDPTGRHLCINVDEDKFDVQKMYIQLLPNLMFLTVNAPAELDKEEALIELINSRPNITGIDWHPPEEKREGPPKVPLANIKLFLLSVELTTSNIQTSQFLTNSITQLYCYEDQLTAIEAVTRCPNLRRLHCFQLITDLTVPTLRKYEGPILNNLEVIEMSLGARWDIQDIRHFLRFLPNVKSIFLHLDKPPTKTLPRARKFFNQVENFVLEMTKERKLPGRIEKFEGLISMFPNLKNLGLRYFRIQAEDQLYHWLRRLSHLSLIDIREWSMPLIDPIYGIDELSLPFESTLSPSKIESWYQNLFDHHLNCCITNLQEEEQQFYFDEFVNGFNFMEHIFHKDFQRSPHFMLE